MYVGCGIKPSLDCTAGSLIFLFALYPFNEILQNAEMLLFIRFFLCMQYALLFLNDYNISGEGNEVNIAKYKIFSKC